MEPTPTPSPRWDRKTIVASLLCLALPFPLPIAHEVFDCFSFTQVAYGELGIMAGLITYLMAISKAGWGKLLAAQVFLTLGFLPRLMLPIFSGILDMSFSQALTLIIVPGIFIAVFLGVHWLFSRLEGPHAQRFTLLMCLVAAAMHTFLLPWLLGEPLRTGTIHIAGPEEMLIETNDAGTLLLTHTGVSSLKTTLYSHREAQLTELRHDEFSGYPVGIRIDDEGVTMALRINNDENAATTIDFIRLGADGHRKISDYACTADEAPTHLVNNLSPDGELLALADGAFVTVATGERVERMPAEVNTDGLVFVEWSQGEGRAVYFHEKEQRLVRLYTRTQVVDTNSLRGHPDSPLAMTVFPDETRVWYQEESLFRWLLAYVEDLDDQTRDRLSLKRGRAREGSVRLWTEDNGLTYINELNALETYRFDNTRLKYRLTRHTQLFDVAADVAYAGEGGWLFWTTQASHGDGIAIHRKSFL